MLSVLGAVLSRFIHLFVRVLHYHYLAAKQHVMLPYPMLSPRERIQRSDI